MNNLLQKLVLGSSVATLAAAMPMAAFAQTNNDIEQVVVSASRISIAGYSQPTPVTVVGAAQLEQDGYANIEDSLRQLPQVQDAASSYGVNQAGGNSGQSGASVVNLRFLGNARTLMLFDGQRVPSLAPFTSGVGGSGDVNSLPPLIIQRVDVVTGGASASWGSDAVAGVVNFVTNRNFNGFKANIDASDTTDGAYRTMAVNGAWGSDFDGGRGHIQVATKVQYNPDTVLLSQEKWFKNAYWVSNPAYAAGNGQPQLIVATNVGYANQTPGGIINSSPAGVAGPGVVAAAANALRGIQFVGAGIPQTVNYGNLTLGTLSNGGSLSNVDTTVPESNIAGPSNNYAVYGYGRYKVTDNIVASMTLNGSYFTGKSMSTGAQQTGVTIRSDNAYIPASIASIIKNGGITSFVLGTTNTNNTNNSTISGNGFYQEQESALGLLVVINRRTTWRSSFNLDGTLGNDWSWAAYYQHGETRNDLQQVNNAETANIAAAQDAVTVTTANVAKSGLPIGSIACRQSLTGTRVTTANGLIADPGCVPLNVFGNGVASSQAIGYIDGAENGTQSYVKMMGEQDVAEGSMQGTLPWELPAGKVAVAFGAGYRKEQGKQTTPAIGRLTGYLSSDASLSPGDVEYNLLEGFGEVNVPVLKNQIVNSFDIDLAGRMTSYSTSGLVETWKLGATSQITDDIKLRTNWSTDIRAPGLSELYNQGTFNSNSARDPKTQATVPVTQVTVGNPNLLPEVAHNISGGVVLTPTFIPGLSMSADWWRINITGEITTLAAASLVTQCNASLPSVIHPGTQGNPNDPLCAFLVFGGTGGALSQVNLSVININSQSESGLDLAANYDMDLWDGSLSLATVDSYVDENTLNVPGQAYNDQIGASGFSQPQGPKWRGLASATYREGAYSFTVQGRWTGTYVAAQNGNTGNQATAATANLYDPAHFEIPMTGLLDLRASYKWNDNIQFFAAVDDALNTPPALAPNNSAQTGPGLGQSYNATTLVSDMLGRVARLGVRFNY